MAAPLSMSIAVFLLSVIALGVYDVLTHFEENGCEMTYMFQYPEYQKIDLGEPGKDFQQYGLYIYGEGSYAKRISKLQLTGIPVLFIPGNAGSHKQVRSLGSVSMKMSENHEVTSHFNYFVAGFEEELSGFYGGVLDRQTEFVHRCLKKILSLYGKAKSKPTSVVLVGHSMGGMIARALFTLKDFDPSLVNTIISQATPHQRPVASVDAQMQQFYNRVNRYWKKHASKTLRHVTVVSTGGGYRDIQVRYGLTVLHGIVPDDRAISTSTTAIPKAWVSTDHLCAVWCRQMVLLTCRALFDVVDKTTGQISTDPELRMKVFDHHFLSNNGLPDYLTREENKSITLDPKVKWEVKEERLWMFKSRDMKKDRYFAVPFVVEENNDALHIQTNVTNPDWVCYCDILEGQDRCKTCTSLSPRTRLLPPLYSNTRYLSITHRDFDVTNNTYVIIKVPAGQKMVHITSDRYNSDERHLVYHMPNTYDSIISYPVSVTDGAAMLKISNASAFYSLHLAGLSLPTNVYTAVVIPQGCRRHSAEAYEGSVLRLNIPWSHEETYTIARYGKEVHLPIKLQTGRPKEYDWRMDASEPHLEMFLHPYCHYQLRLLAATQDTVGQAIRFYAIMYPGFYVAVLLLVLVALVVGFGKGQASTLKAQSPSDLVFDSAKPFYITPAVVILRFVIQFGPIAKFLTNLGVPKDDGTLLTEENIYFTFLPALLYISAWLATYIQAFVVFKLLSVASYFGRLFTWVPDSVTLKLPLLQLLISGTAVALTFLCGTLGILLTSALLIFKVIYLLYVIGRKLDTKETHSKLYLFFTLMLLVNWQALLSLGPFVVWVKAVITENSYFYQLTPDPSRIPSLVVTVCVAILFRRNELTFSKSQSQAIGFTFFITAVLVILYAMESLYRLPVFIAFTILVITIPAVLGLLSDLVRTGRKKED